MLSWCIFYDNDETFSSDDGLPEEAPRQGIVCIVQDSRILWNSDTYCWEQNMWVVHDRYACERYLDNEREPIRLVGYCLPDDKFQAIMQRAKKYKRG